MKYSTPLVLMLCALCGFVVAGCAETRSEGETSAVIGPEGGVLEVTDSSSALYGLRVDVPPGALTEESLVSIEMREPSPELPEMPAGLAAFAPIFELTSEMPFVSDVRIKFPMQILQDHEGEIPSGFHLPETDGKWRTALPVNIEDDGITVQTGRLGHWRWGLMLLEDTEYETIRPSMEDIHGEENWEERESAAEEEFMEIITELHDIETWSSCDTLLFVIDVLIQTRETAKQDVFNKLSNACGGCEISPDQFIQELIQYAQANVRHFIVNLTLDAIDLPFLLGLYIKLEVAIYFENVKRSLSCDYECLIAESPGGFWADLATYYVAEIILFIIAIGSDYQECV